MSVHKCHGSGVILIVLLLLSFLLMTAAVQSAPAAAAVVGSGGMSAGGWAAGPPAMAEEAPAAREAETGFAPAGLFYYYVRASVAGPGGTVSPKYREYLIFSVATVNIYPSPGYRIASLSDNGKFVPISNPYRMHVYRNHNVVVTFAPIEFTVGASVAGGGGTVSPASQKVQYGHAAAVDIIPDAGKRIQSITDNGVGVPISDPYHIDNVTGDHSVVVTFTADTYTVAASVAGGHGSVDPLTQDIAHGGTASITITPDDTYQIATITDNGVSVAPSNPYVINGVSEDHDVVVTFHTVDYMVAASVLDGQGTVDPPTQIVVSGDPATITITPDPGYHIAAIMDNNVSMPVTNPYVIASVTEHHSVVVLFAPDAHTVAASATGAGGGVNPPTQGVPRGGTAAVFIQPQEGYHIASISDNDEVVAISNPYVILQVEEDHEVKVTFAPDIFAVNAYAPGGGGTVTPPVQEVTYGHTAAIDVVPDAGEVIASIVDNAVPQPPSDPYIIENVTSDHEVVASFAPGNQPSWYLAEGSTAWGFSTYITLINPGVEDLNATLTYMLTDGSEQQQTVGLPAFSQVTVWPSALLGEADFSTVVECLEGKSIAVDRTMYWTGPGALSPEGHCSVGVTAPQNTWYLPEGSSDWGFETWVLVLNPGSVDASVTLTYMVEGEDPVEAEKTVPAHTRASFDMASDIGTADASIMVSSDQLVIAERSMYRNNRREGHCSVGSSAPSDTFYLAEGTTAWGFTTYLLVQNPGLTEANVTVTYMTPSGPKEQPPFAMPPRSRRTIRVNDVADVSSTDVSTELRADAPIVAERAMYWGADTGLGEACHASIGMVSPHVYSYLPDGQTSEGRETYTLVQNPGDEQVRIEVRYLLADGAEQAGFVVDVPARSRMTFDMGAVVPAARAGVKVSCLTPGRGILVERAMYWNNRGAGMESIGGSSN